MRSLISAILFLFTIAPFVLADYSITNPGTGVTWKKGDTVTVEWIITSKTDNTVDVKLLRGRAENLQPVITLCTGVDPTVGHCNFAVPDNLASDHNYAVTVGNDVSHTGYSSFFSIESSGDLPPQSGCPNFGGQNCPSTLPCCSFAGYCGDSDDHCGRGCMPQFSFNGLCVKSGGAPPVPPKNNTIVPPPKSTTIKHSPTKTSSKKPLPKKTQTKKSPKKKTSTKKSPPKKTSTKHSTKTKHPQKKTSIAKKPVNKAFCRLR
ncbi:14384_t:CDS:2 [Acaulospora morrowiae]|uniref:14384_t:CDS:1 n=1 Tax=Acaulospora morrowiae TaxID=94023 RepID=A0A9N9BXK9_9GLOM|nr:14384_t:CDS:2 [Acaulospora morrowiae]